MFAQHMLQGAHRTGCTSYWGSILPIAALILATGCQGTGPDDVAGTTAELIDDHVAPFGEHNGGATDHDDAIHDNAVFDDHAHGELHAFAVRLSKVLKRADFVGEVQVRRITGRDGFTGRAKVDAIWSDIEFDVGEVIKDANGSTAGGNLTLSFLGGNIGDRAMHVDHLPQFQEGDRAILIVKSDEKPSPTFAGQYGVLPIRDGRVHTYFGHYLAGINDRGYQVLTPAHLMPTAPAPTPMGDATGRVVKPEVGTLADALLPSEALAELQFLMEVSP